MTSSIHSGSGRAYAFCQAGCSIEKLRHEMNRFKAMPDQGFPPAMKVFVNPLIGVSRGSLVVAGTSEHQLVVIAREWVMKGANFFVKTMIPGKTNEQAANWLLKMVTSMYTTKEVMGRIVRPVLDIYYRDEDKHLFVSKIDPNRTYGAVDIRQQQDKTRPKPTTGIQVNLSQDERGMSAFTKEVETLLAGLNVKHK